MIPILLIGLGIGSTLAMFNAEAAIENPISFRSNLSYDSSVTETKEVTIPYKSDKTIDIVLPDKLYAVVGDTLQIFYSGIVKVKNYKNYDF